MLKMNVSEGPRRGPLTTNQGAPKGPRKKIINKLFLIKLILLLLLSYHSPTVVFSISISEKKSHFVIVMIKTLSRWFFTYYLKTPAEKNVQRESSEVRFDL